MTGDLEMLPSPLLLRIEAAVGDVGNTPSDAFRQITEYCWLWTWSLGRSVADKPVDRSRVVGVLPHVSPFTAAGSVRGRRGGRPKRSGAG